jgi:hypothetical protein
MRHEGAALTTNGWNRALYYAMNSAKVDRILAPSCSAAEKRSVQNGLHSTHDPLSHARGGRGAVWNEQFQSTVFTSGCSYQIRALHARNQQGPR